MTPLPSPTALRARLGTMARLGRWLGPWTDSARVPGGVVRRELAIEARAPGDRPFRAFVFSPEDRAPSGALLLVPGLHYLGPLDPRLDRFARVLAASGLLVVSPLLPDFEAMILDRALFRDVERAFDALLALPDRPASRPGVFSISFGSLPALHLASARGDELGALVVFGGYADFHDTLRFCLHGRPGAAHDPLNRPVVFLNLLDRLPDRPRDPAPLVAAIRRYVAATWGRPEMKIDGRWQAVAREIAEELDPALRPLFFQATGVEGSGWFDAALARSGDAFAWLDPRPLLAGVRCAVHLIHGADDDVIPFEHAHQLAAGLPRDRVAGVHITGLYGHTHAANAKATLAQLPALAREIATMARMLAAVASAGG